jgi:hypothetical protein
MMNPVSQVKAAIVFGLVAGVVSGLPGLLFGRGKED